MSQKALLLTGKWLDRHHTFTRRSTDRPAPKGLLKVTVNVKGHVIRALLSCHENRLFSRANCSIVTKRAHNVPREGLHLGSAQGQGRGQRSRDTGSFVMSQKMLLLAGKWLDRHRTFTARSPEGPALRMTSRSRSRSKVM